MRHQRLSTCACVAFVLARRIGSTTGRNRDAGSAALACPGRTVGDSGTAGSCLRDFDPHTRTEPLPDDDAVTDPDRRSGPNALPHTDGCGNPAGGSRLPGLPRLSTGTRR